MTPEQAARAAAVLRLHMPSDPESYSACLEAIDHLQGLGVSSAMWRYCPETKTLHAGEPGGRDRLLVNVGDFALDVALAWRAYPHAVNLEASVLFDDATRATLKARRWALSTRLDATHMPRLAQAVRDVKLRERAGEISAVYSPEGRPINLN